MAQSGEETNTFLGMLGALGALHSASQFDIPAFA